MPSSKYNKPGFNSSWLGKQVGRTPEQQVGSRWAAGGTRGGWHGLQACWQRALERLSRPWRHGASAPHQQGCTTVSACAGKCRPLVQCLQLSRPPKPPIPPAAPPVQSGTGGKVQVFLTTADGSNPPPIYPVAGTHLVPLKRGQVVELVLQVRRAGQRGKCCCCCASWWVSPPPPLGGCRRPKTGVITINHEPVTLLHPCCWLPLLPSATACLAASAPPPPPDRTCPPTLSTATIGCQRGRTAPPWSSTPSTCTDTTSG